MTKTPPQPEERPKKDVAFVSYITAKIPSHPDTLRIDGKEKMKQFMSVLATRDNYCTSNIEGAKSILPMANEAIDSLLSQEKERWENELRENVEGLHTVFVADILQPNGGNYLLLKQAVLALISNKRKE